MAKRKWRWVTRCFGEAKTVEIHEVKTKPKLEGRIYSTGKYRLVSLDEFVVLTGITIKPGECVKVEFTAKVVE